MANPNKIDPHWKFEKELIREVNKAAPRNNSKPDEFAEVCIYEQLAIRAKDLGISVRKHYVKTGIYFDLKNLANTVNIPVQGSLREVFNAVIAISSLNGGGKYGKEAEIQYLESAYKLLLKLKGVDEGLYEDILSQFDKKTKKWHLFQEYLTNTRDQLSK